MSLWPWTTKQPVIVVARQRTDFASAMARLGTFLGYRVTVCDAREVFATRRRFPMADEVVDVITSRGGEAVANYDSVSSWEGAQRMSAGMVIVDRQKPVDNTLKGTSSWLRVVREGLKVLAPKGLVSSRRRAGHVGGHVSRFHCPARDPLLVRLVDGAPQRHRPDDRENPRRRESGPPRPRDPRSPRRAGPSAAPRPPASVASRTRSLLALTTSAAASAICRNGIAMMSTTKDIISTGWVRR